MNKKIEKILRNIYIWLGLPSAPEGTLPNSIHKILKKIIYLIIHKNKNNIDKNTFSVGLYSGIGDTLWSIVLIKCLFHKYNIKNTNLYIHTVGNDIRNGRANSYLKRFSFVNNVLPLNFQIMKVPFLDDNGYLRYINTGENTNLPFNYFLGVNTYLEKGYNFNKIAEILNFNKEYINYYPFNDYRWEPEDFDEVNRILDISPKGYCIFYFGPLSGNTDIGLNRGGLWKIEDWINLGKLIYKKTNMKIVIVGASYDIDYVKLIQDNSDKDFHTIYINNCGTLDLTKTIALLKKANFVIAFASGIPISSVYLRTNTAIFWRPQHLSIDGIHEKYGFHKDFSTDWVPEDMILNKKYIPLWYTIDTYDTVYKKIKDYKWI